MSLFASWVHGNAVVVEAPQNLDRVGHFGWGGDMLIKPGHSSWFHIALPTPVIVSGVRAQLNRVFVMFMNPPGSGEIQNVHVYDGSGKVQEFNGLHLSGEHRLGLDAENRFDLAAPHTVVWGIGISFLFQASVGIDSPVPDSQLIISSAGGDYTV